MPTYLRLLIMIGEIIGLMWYSFNVLKKEYTDKDKKFNISVIINTSDGKMFTILNIINILIFIFSFCDLIFCSYHKLIMLSCYTIGVITLFLNIKKAGQSSFVSILCCISLTVALIAVIASAISLVMLFTDEENIFIDTKQTIKEEEYDETLYPMNLTEKSVIAYNKEYDSYIFFYQNDNEYHFEDNMKPEDVIVISKGDSYVVKNVKVKTLLNEEYPASSKNYITEETETSFTLYLNKEQMISIETD